MTDMENREAGIDRLLRRSMDTPVPSLPPDFDKRLIRELGQSSQPLGGSRRILLACYGLLSVMTSAVVMRSEGLGWSAVAVMILGPLALVGTLRWTRRAISG